MLPSLKSFCIPSPAVVTIKHMDYQLRCSLAKHGRPWVALREGIFLNTQLIGSMARLCRAYDFDPLKEAQAFQQAAPVAKREETAPKPPQHVSCLLQTAIDRLSWLSQLERGALM